jgi:PAS domain S-box-containing protein
LERIIYQEDIGDISADVRITVDKHNANLHVQKGCSFNSCPDIQKVGKNLPDIIRNIDIKALCSKLVEETTERANVKRIFRTHFDGYDWILNASSTIDRQTDDVIIDIEFICDCDIQNIDGNFETALKNSGWITELIDRSQEAVVLLDARNGEIKFANKSALRLVNRTKEEVEGQHYNVLFAEDYYPENYEEEAKALFNGKPTVIRNIKLENHASRSRDATVRAELIKIGRFKYIYTVISENRISKHLERQDEYSHFKALFDDSLMGSILVDLEGRIFDINNAFTKITGYTRARIDAINILDLAYEVFDKRTADKLIGSFQRSGKISNEEVLLRTIDDDWRWARLSSSIIHDNKGQSLFFIVTIENIHDVKQTELKYRENQNLLTSLSANLNEGIYRSSLDNGIVFANDAFVDKFGYESFSEIENSTPEIFYADEKQRQDVVEEILNKGRIIGKEIYFKRKDGSRFWGLMNSSLYYDDEGKKYLDGVITDISSQKKNERLLKKRNKELKKINKEMDKFVYSITHDLRAPLMSILGLLKLSKDENRQESLVDYFSLMEKSVLKLDEFIKDIIDYSRNTRTEIDNELIEFENLINETWNNLQYIEEAGDIHFEIIKELPDDFEFRSDPRRLGIVLSNLMSNAVRYHNYNQEHPEISVVLRHHADNLQILVKDNGPGIPREYQEKIFEMFFRANQSKNGSGLGLYIVKDTIEKLKGEIDLKSDPVRGSTFTIKLPLS